MDTFKSAILERWFSGVMNAGDGVYLRVAGNLKPKDMNNMRTRITYLLGLAVFITIISACQATKSSAKTSAVKHTACDTTMQKLAYADGSAEFIWLTSNKDQCSRINEFFRMFNYTDDSIEYMKSFVELKLSDDEFKLERFIELYCLLNQNPNALIDGTLEKSTKN